MDMTIRTKGSLCTGVGGLDAAAPGALAWVSETNEQAASILKREHPEVPNLGDITAPGFAPSPIDLLTSGDPCQSMSAAGRQLASDDERFLWPYVMDRIDGLRPRTLFLENVQNLTSVPLVKGGEKGSVLKLRLDDLREAGYAVRWIVLGACAVGAPPPSPPLVPARRVRRIGRSRGGARRLEMRRSAYGWAGPAPHAHHRGR